MKRQIKKFENLWQRKTGGCSSIQNGRDGKSQSNGTTVSSNEDHGTTQTTTINIHKQCYRIRNDRITGKYGIVESLY